MVIVADKEVDGLKALEENISEFKLLLENVFLAANGCDNTKKLSINLIKTYGAILKLEKALKDL